MSTGTSHETDPKKAQPAGRLSRRDMLLTGTSALATSGLQPASLAAPAEAQPATPAAPSGRRPNILVTMGDDIGQSNVSAYTFGLMGYKTPNIDRIAKEGTMFTDYYAKQSCMAGRSSFITGQATLRTGLSKVRLPGAKLGLQAEDITIAEALPVRQESLGRSKRISADGAPLR